MKIVMVLCMLAACSTGQATVHKIKVSNFQFSPKRVNALVGDTILFVYKNGFHTTTSTTIPAGALPWDSPMDVNTTRFSYVLTVAGTYNYLCLPHSAEMRGLIKVFSPAAAVNSFTVKPGAKGKPSVAWSFNNNQQPTKVLLQRSYNAVDFETIKTYDSPAAAVKSYTDHSVRSNAFVYYLLQTVDSSGELYETGILPFAYKAPVQLIVRLAPNPLTSPHLEVQFNAVKEGAMYVVLSDDKGRIIIRESFSAEKGINNAHLHLDEKLVKPGIYYLRCNLGAVSETHKIIKQ